MAEQGYSAPGGGGLSATAVPLDVFLPLMRAKGVTLAPEEFHAAINEIFHGFEASYYDRFHRDMWESLPRQFELLVDDYLRANVPKRKIAVLDVGCGTGLSAELLLRTGLGPYIHAIDLLDTSPEMLAACRRRQIRGARHLIRGRLADAPMLQPYDVIVACSVLHHIPDVAAAARAVAARQAAGGVFIHLQDPNADYHNDPERNQREQEWRVSGAVRLRRAAVRVLPRRLAAAAVRRLKGVKQPGFLDLVNDELLRRRITRARMTAPELWSVTDLHEHHAPGISIDTLAELLPEYSLVSRRSYAFFGELESNLSGRFRKMEREWITCKSQNGSRAGALWIRQGDLRIHE